MSDRSVAEALRSTAPRVIIDAPAGTGKTYQAADYARDVARQLRDGERALVLAHTHAACDVFSARVAGLGSRVRVGTFDSLIFQIASAYHRSLRLPADVRAWSIDQGQNSFGALATMVHELLARSSAITGALAARHPVMICDEHQDASEDQHGIVDLLIAAGSKARFFGDPMQAIFGSAREVQEQQLRWGRIAESADVVEQLDTAHRWASGSPALGEWVLNCRESLRAGVRVDLRAELPQGLTILRAENLAPRRGSYRLAPEERRPLDAIVRNSQLNGERLLVLTPHNDTVRGLNAFWGRRLPIWEGHARDALGDLVGSCRRHDGDAVALGAALCSFLSEIGTGFGAAAFGDRFVQELRDGCARPRRGKPAEIQGAARLIFADPTHTGVGAALEEMHRLTNESPSFADCRIDLRREFHEAKRLREDQDIGTVITHLTHQRRLAAGPKESALSTVHKSKGLETRNAIVIPCDTGHFPDNGKSRCLLYVALSRACNELTLVFPREAPSHLFVL
jgi:hypothetical protein